MKTTRYALAIAVAVVALVGPGPVRADDFSFSFTNTDGNLPGTVTGEILGLTNNATTTDAEVILTSYPSFFDGDPDFASPLPVLVDSFTEMGGVITAYAYEAEAADTLLGLISTGISKTSDDHGGLGNGLPS